MGETKANSYVILEGTLDDKGNLASIFICKH